MKSKKIQKINENKRKHKTELVEKGETKGNKTQKKTKQKTKEITKKLKGGKTNKTKK